MAYNKFRCDDAFRLLTFEEVFKIHQIALNEGGLAGILNRGAIEGALFRPQNLRDYVGCDDLVLLAASLWYALSNAHGFCDGNKRTAVLSAFAFLESNGVTIDGEVPADEPGWLVDGLYQMEKFEERRLANYLATRCVWIGTP